MKLKKLKRAVIKEEFVAITGDYISAIILNQFLYWSDRVNDFDRMLAEEKRIAEKDGIELNMQPKHGWIYKKADELIEETMIGISANCMRTKIKLLTSKGYLLERKNPCYKWDHTKQYRVNFKKIQYDLHQQGYELDGYRITPETLTTPEITETHTVSYDVPPDELRNSPDELYNSPDEFHNSGDELQYQRLHTENTTKTTSKKVSKGKSFDEIIKDFCNENKKLEAELKKYLKMRFTKEKRLSNASLEEALNKLLEVSEYNEADMIEIVNKAVRKGQLDFYPLSEKEKQSNVNQNSWGDTGWGDSGWYAPKTAEDFELLSMKMFGNKESL